MTKNVLLVCTASSLVALAATGATDNPAQARARQALEQALREQQAQTVPATPAAAAPTAAPRPASVAPVAGGGDNPAQARAREALERALREQQGTAPQAPTAPAAATVSRPAPAPAPAPAPVQPVVKAPAPRPATAPILSGADNPAQARAREALEKAMREQQAAPATTQSGFSAVPAANATAVRVPTVSTQPTPQVGFAPVPPANPDHQRALELTREKQQELVGGGAFAPLPPVASNPNLERARQMMREKEAELIKSGAHPGVAAQQEALSAPGTDRTLTREQREAQRRQAMIEAQQKREYDRARNIAGWFEPLPGPELPISADKQAKLAELLKRYRADEITPDQYQSERAKILAAP